MLLHEISFRRFSFGSPQLGMQPAPSSPCASMLAAAVEDTVSASARLTAAVTTVDPEERRKIEMDRMIERHRKKELIQKERRDELIRLESENADSRFVVDPQRGPQVRSDSVVEPDGPQERSGANCFDIDVVVGTFRQ